MGWWANLETDRMESLAFLWDDGNQGGKSFFAFTSMMIYCDKLKDKEIFWSPWIITLDELAGGKLCDLMKPLVEARYSGEFQHYQEDEYPIYKLRYPDDPTNEQVFIHAVRFAANCWQDIHLMTAHVEQIIKLFTMLNIPDEEEQNEPKHILKDFEALYKALLIFKERKARRVRILII